MELNAQYPHLDAYQDVTLRIDEAMKTLDFLLDYQKTYFSVQGTLRPVLRRINDEYFVEKMVSLGNEAAIKERERALPYRETIEQLIEDIDTFEAESKKLLCAIVKNGILHSKEFVTLYSYLYNLAEDNSCHDRVPFELIGFFYENTREKCDLFSDEEYAIFIYLLIRIKAKGRYYFAYPHLADELVRITLATKQMPYNSRTGFLLEAGDYYARACQRDKAMTCYKNAADASAEKGALEDAAYALQKYYRLNRSFPEAMQVKPDVDAIKREYGRYSSIVMQGIAYPCFKVDPVEFSEGFAERFQTVMQRVEAEIDKVGDLQLPHQRWSLMEKYFAELGIAWRSPRTMNPGVMFD